MTFLQSPFGAIVAMSPPRLAATSCPSRLATGRSGAFPSPCGKPSERQ